MSDDNTPAFRRVQVLLVDDDKYHAKELQARIKGLGLEVRFVSSVDKAIEIVAGLAIDEVSYALIDRMLPPGKAFADSDTGKGSLTGILLAREIQKTRKIPQVAVISSLPLPPADHRKLAKEDLTYILKGDNTLMTDFLYDRVSDASFARRVLVWLRSLSNLTIIIVGFIAAILGILAYFGIQGSRG